MGKISLSWIEGRCIVPANAIILFDIATMCSNLLKLGMTIDYVSPNWNNVKMCFGVFFLSNICILQLG